jgi:hypothetical protein
MRMTSRFRVSILVCCTLICLCSISKSVAFGQVQVLTEHNDGFRSGANINETILTPANVNTTTFGKLFSQGVDGYIVGQPLYVSNLKFPNGTQHNVVYVATQHDSVYAFDADSVQAPLWIVSFINAAAGITSVPIHDFGCPGTAYTEIGIMSTPVIDTTAGAIYVVVKTLENGAYIYRLHAMSLTTGQDLLTPEVISASVTTNKGTLQFNPAIQMQRPALLLSNSTIYIGFGSNGCDTFAFHGWLLAYNQSTLQPSGTFVVTPNGTNGAIWQAGGGPAADNDGSIFLATGNGTFDGSSGGADWGDSLLHLSPAGNGLSVLDYFTPYNEQTLSDNDLDLGSGGVLLVPDQDGPNTHEVIAGGKEGTLYLVDRDGMGGFNSVNDSQIVQSIHAASTGEIDSVPAYWNGNVYVSGVGDSLKAFSLSNGQLSTAPVSQTSFLFNQSGSGSVSVSSNSQLSNGIVWAMLHSQTASILYAFPATNLATELYDSRQAKNARDALAGVAHFATPTIANGKVFIGGTKAFYVYGLLPAIKAVSGSGQTGFLNATLPIALIMQASDAYSGNGIANAVLTCKDGGAGGTFSNPTPQTNSAGQASTTYTLPNRRANITITCSALGYISASFSEASVAGPPSRDAATTGNNQTGPISTKLPVALTVSVFDPHNYGVPGVTVTFSDNGAGGTFSALSVITGSTGQATTTYTAPAKPGIVTVTASVAGLAPVNFRESIFGAPSRMVVSTGNNQTGPPSTQLPTALGVTVFDANNIGVPNITVQFSDGGAGGSFSSTTAITGSNGRATTLYTTPATTGVVNGTVSATGVPTVKFKETVD